MSGIENIIQNATDKEMSSVYDNLIRNQNFTVAYELRTKFILTKIYATDPIEWAGTMKYFIEKEEESINQNYAMVELNDSNRHKYMSQITPFLLIKLMNEGLINEDPVRIIELEEKEAGLLSKTTFNRHFLFSSLNLLLGYEDKAEEIIRPMLRRARNTYQSLLNMPIRLTGNEDVSIIEETLETLVTYTVRNGNTSPERLRLLQEQLLILFTYQWYRKNMDRAKELLELVLQVSDKREVAYVFLKFLKHDFH